MTGGEAMTRVRAVVRGRVQGVGFRWSAHRMARDLGVTGWVRNRPDGGVEVLLEGPAGAVERMTAWLRVGPAAARVADVRLTEEPYRREFADFTIEPS